MQGAKEYAELLGTGNFEKLSFESGSHARGKTFHVWILGNDGKRSVEVYGVVGGNPGWTESYGWLHSGKWQDDFEKLVASTKLKNEARLASEQVKAKEIQEAECLRIQTLLAQY